MVKGEDFGNHCIGNGSCFSKRLCIIECAENGLCICGLNTAIYKYIRHNECPHNCILFKCKCGLDIPQIELDKNDGICDDCNDNNN
jgi:hypothetical protein